MGLALASAACSALPEPVGEVTSAATRAWCAAPKACDAAPPAPGPRTAWRHPTQSSLVSTFGKPRHRGRDLLLAPGDPQWIIAKLAYGLLDADLKGEDVDIYLLRDCVGPWEKLGTAVTTREHEHATTLGVRDSGGRIYFRIPDDRAVGLGRHRVHLVVKGDLSTADLFLDIEPPAMPLFVSDVDGTLTSSEDAEIGAILTAQLPAVHPGAAEAFHALAEKGYRPFYLTARPEWLTGRTRDVLDVNGFPPGIVHTTTTTTGALGSQAAAFKRGELATLADKGIVPSLGFGNMASDADAYDDAGIPEDDRFFYRFDDIHGGQRIDDYAEVMPAIEALPSLCP